jgi:transposase
VAGKQNNPLYSEEFRRDAVRLASSPGRNPAEVARELGVSGASLRNWMRAARPEDGGVDLTADERAELRELRKKVKQQDEVISILKKAAAFFATDPR